MEEILVKGITLPHAYHKAILSLATNGVELGDNDYGGKMKEVSLTFQVMEPLRDPMISKLFVGGPQELQQYVMEICDGILDFMIYEPVEWKLEQSAKDTGWKYTYHSRMRNFPAFYYDDFGGTFSCGWKKDKGIDQVQFVITDLKRSRYSRRAVINLRDNTYDTKNYDAACVNHIQFFIRDDKLHCKVLIRSNDAVKASFMNAFALIKLQEKIAKELEVPVGTYSHKANSYHCYEKDFLTLERYQDAIMNKHHKELVYNYEGDWKELMMDSVPNILKNIETMKINKESD